MTLALLAWLLSIAALGAAFAFFRRGERVAGMAVVLALLVQAHVRPAMFLLGLDTPVPRAFFEQESWDLIATGSLMAAVWTLCLTGAYLAAAALGLPERGLLPQAPARPGGGAVLAVAGALTLACLAATAAFVVESGSVARFLFAVKVGKDFAGLYLFREIGTLAAIVAAFGLLLHAGPGGGTLPHRRRRAALAAGLIAVNFALGFLWGARFNIALLGIALGIGWHYHVRRFRLWEALALTLALALLLEALRWTRLLLTGAALGQEVAAGLDFWTALSASLHFSEFDALLLAIRDVGERFDWRGGQDFVNGLLSWVPRALYPEKESFQIGFWFRRLYDPDKLNGWPVTVIGAWYINFGAAGLLLGAALSGLVAAAFDAAYRDLRGSAWAAAVGPMLAFSLLGGGFGFGFPQRVVLLVLPLYLVTVLLRAGSASYNATSAA